MARLRYLGIMLANQHSPAEIAAADEASDDEVMAEYEAKGGIIHEAIRAWLLSWGTEAELSRPQIGD
jgi:predicted transcriptional regulator